MIVLCSSLTFGQCVQVDDEGVDWLGDEGYIDCDACSDFQVGTEVDFADMMQLSICYCL